jgi:hypothetical protein
MGSFAEFDLDWSVLRFSPVEAVEPLAQLTNPASHRGVFRGGISLGTSQRLDANYILGDLSAAAFDFGLGDEPEEILESAGTRQCLAAEGSFQGGAFLFGGRLSQAAHKRGLAGRCPAAGNSPAPL